MFEKVLIPTDFSRYTSKMAECVTEIPGTREVVLLNVLDASNPKLLEKSGWSYDAIISEAAFRLNEEAKLLASNTCKKEASLMVKPILKVIVEPMSGADGVNLKAPEPRVDADFVYGGTVGDAIQKTAWEENVSLIIMGAQGKGMLEGMLLGSVSTEVLRQGETDLLILRHKMLEKGKEANKERFCPDIFSRVLVATDLSAAAEDAITLAKELEGTKEILLAHVISKDGEFDRAAEKLNRMRQDLEQPGRIVTVHILKGKPADQILELAEKQDASLLIISSQGKGWIKQMRLGSTSFDVARRSDRPVLVVRQKKS